MSKSVERRLAHQKKSKLEELGGLREAKYWVRANKDDCEDASIDFCEALIERVESLTAERDELKKRVEELKAKLQEAMLKFDEALSLAKDQERQLQAARKLAEREVTDYGKYLDGSPGHMLATFQRVEMARDFLKTLEGLNP